MTNHWNDIANADCILGIGANPAENHPAAFTHINDALSRGGKLIVVDPRFTRSASKATIYAPMRSGTDVAFIGGMIKYVIDDMEANPQNYNMVYVTEYTNASYLVNPGYKGPPDLDGLFSGYDSGKRAYDKATWSYQLDDKGLPKRDPTLKDPNCVFQLMKKQYARYSPDQVSQTTGTPMERFLEVCRTYAATGAPDKAGTVLYAMGTTQHTNGSQVVRSYAVLQLLLGNIGICGGGVNAMRGESNVQGSTDMGLLFHLLTGYLKAPINTDTTLQKYLERITPQSKDPKSANWWQNTPKYVVSLLKSWYGDAATKENEFAYQLLPKATGNYSVMSLIHAMYDGVIKGLMCWGMNPAVSSPNAGMTLQALEKLDWLVSTDLWSTETANFWQRPGVNPASIRTEVIELPASASYEKEGSTSNSSRWLQWRYKGADSPGDARPDLDIVIDLMARIKKLYENDSAAPNRDAVARLVWNYGAHPDPNQVAREVNGYDLVTGKLMASFANLKDDGTTSCGCWIYCGSYTEAGNMMARRSLDDAPFNVGLYSKWAWCWPLNRRILYNRAGVDLKGNPWNEKRPVIKWDAQGAKWLGDVPDGGFPPMEIDPVATRYPFIMTTEGHGHLFGPATMVDGPFPEHYEPWESPTANPLSRTQNDPCFKIWAGNMDLKGSPDRYPIVCTTYRVVEHWQAGQMTRNSSWPVELMPEMFVEIGTDLAAEKGISNGRMVIIETARGTVKAKALVTIRFKPFHINGKVIHEIGMPWHWGYIGISKGDSANMLTPNVGDANTMIPEYKAFLCNVRLA
jgi:formate dehydrogenase-N alpha subunit